jgi:hypothetical protein
MVSTRSFATSLGSKDHKKIASMSHIPSNILAGNAILF